MAKITKNSSSFLVGALWYTSVFSVIVSAFVGLLRLFDYMWTAQYQKITIPTCLLLAILILFKQKKIENFDLLSFLLLACIPLGVFTSIVTHNLFNFRSFFPHLFTGIFCFVMYRVGFITNWNLKWLEKTWFLSGKIILYAFIISISAFWCFQLFLDSPLYFGIGTSDLVIPFAYFLVHKKNILALIVITLVVLSGKKGSILAVFATFMFFIKLPFAKKVLEQTILLTFLLILLVFFANKTQPFIDLIRIPEPFESLKNRLFLLNFLQPGFDISFALSNRDVELLKSFKIFQSNSWNWVVGLGYGWQYFYDASIHGASTTNFWSHYVHFSPVNFLYLYGLPISFCIFAALFKNVSCINRISLKPNSPKILKIMKLYWLGTFISSLSGYSYPTDPLFWIISGAMGKICLKYSKGARLSVA